MSLQSERIQLLMQRLSLTEMVHGYESLAEQAAQKNLPYCDFLEQVLESEANPRQERNIKVRTQLAGFPDVKRLEQFDFKFPASIDEKKIRELASLRFLERHENALFLGPPGVGKTHLAVSLGLDALPICSLPPATRRRSANWRVCVSWSVTRTPCFLGRPGWARPTWRSPWAWKPFVTASVFTSSACRICSTAWCRRRPRIACVKRWPICASADSWCSTKSVTAA